MIRSQDTARIIVSSSVVVCARVTHREVLRVPYSTVMKEGSQNDEECDNSNESIGNSMPVMAVSNLTSIHGWQLTTGE